ncbi:MAG: dephospho-CoA kinase [Pseudonocardiaceae bacterium]
MLRVGLTGGIGSGKSLVADQLRRCGAWLIDSDRIAREVVEPGTAGLDAVVNEFGGEILAKDGTLDRLALAARVFDDADARGRLNAIVHPLVAARSAELLAAAPSEAIVIHDVPLLVETGMSAGFPLVIVVHADAAVRLRRLIDQRGMAECDATARIAAQASDEQRRAVADVWLDNSGSKDSTLAAADRLWEQRLVLFEANLRHRSRAARAASPVLVAPDDSWPQQAQRVIARLATVAGRRALRIDHIGSTAVPGLEAKDVLDVQVVVKDLAVATQLADDLIAAGLVRPTGRWWDNARDGTTRDKVLVANADPARAVNCHIRPTDSPAWREAVLLRDWLRAHPAGVQDYAQLKHRLAALVWDSIEDYANAKTPFVSNALDHAEQWARRTGWQVA